MPFDEEELDPHGECAAEIKRLRDALMPCLGWLEYAYRNVDSPTATAVKAHLPRIREVLNPT